MKTLASVIVCASLLVPVTARAAEGYFDDGNSLYRLCSEREIICTATFSAYFDMMSAWGYKCSAESVNRVQLRDVGIKYLKDNPADRHLPAPFLAIFAFQKAFNCSIPKKTGN